MSFSQAPPQRLQWIDQIKGVAILAIVLFHFCQNYPDQFSLVAGLNRNGAKLGYAAVDIFFVMAGFNISFVMATKPQVIEWKSWLQKRIARLYPTYFLAVGCSLLLYVLLRGTKLSLDVKLMLSCLGLAGYNFQAINPGFWFFTVILEIYLATPLLFRFCQGKPERLLMTGILLGVLTKIIAAWARGGPWYIYFLQTNFLGSYLFQYCLGLYWGFIYVQYQGFRRIDWLIATGIFTAGFLSYVGLDLKGVDIVYMLGFDIVFTPFMFMALQQGLQQLAHIPSCNVALSGLAIAGVYSYQIYLIHQPLLVSVFPHLAKLIALGQIPKLLLSFLVISVLLVLYVYVFTALENFLRKCFTRPSKLAL
jgi:peptidoglycan/LPS O-acetylase OafA/YrhL